MWPQPTNDRKVVDVDDIVHNEEMYSKQNDI